MGNKPVGIEEFNEMFDLDGSTNDEDQAEEYGSSTDSDESFDKLAKEMSGEIGESGEGVSAEKEDPHDIIMDVMSNDSIADSKKEVSPELTEEKAKKIIKDALKTTKEESLFEEEEEEEEEKVEKEDETGEGDLNNQEVSIVDDRIQWLLDSPSAMYDAFYEKKKELINIFMVGGQVEYIKWMNELADAHINIQSEVFDQEIVMRQMEGVQQHRERVKYINIRVNNQYYMFKRYVELMRGFLARVQYIKPIIKQEGLILEHMRDIELYLTRLESLHDSVTKTEKTLAAAYDTLSRKVTICMELKPVERYEKKAYPTYNGNKFNSDIEEQKSKPKQNLDDFDDLPDNVVVKSEDKVGPVGWGEI